MDSQFNHPAPVSKGADIINKARSVKLNPSVLYEAVVDLSSEGLLTANCINMAAGILLEDLGLPTYFFENIKGSYPVKRRTNWCATCVRISPSASTGLRNFTLPAG